MYKVLLLAVFLSLSACTPDSDVTNHPLNSFLEQLRNEGVKGNLQVGTPINEDMEYLATYVISAYTSTRILSFFKFRDVEQAERNLKAAEQNPKLTGTARNGTIVIAATFYPPDSQAVEKIRDLFLAHRFD